MITITLGNPDWDRVVFALSHFSHNEEFQQTLTKVLDALTDDRDKPDT